MKSRTKQSLRILDFDIENRPLEYTGWDRPGAEVTAIAWCWTEGGQHGPVQSWALRPDGNWWDTEAGYTNFTAAYDTADMVTGHYIREHDLPILNGARLERGLPPLAPKLTCDTKLDLVKFKDVSKSQENLALMLGLTAQKHHMSRHEWRQANRLGAAGRDLTRERVEADVAQHMELRLALLGLGALGPPKVWRP